MLDAAETGFLFDDPLLVIFVPGSGKRLEIIGGTCADSIANFIRGRWIDTDAVRVIWTDKGKEGEGVIS